VYKTAGNTLFIGKNIAFVAACPSTNDLALSLLQRSHPAEGTVVITHHQTAGRGQRGNQWQAQPGQNLTLSLILKPSFLSVKQQFLLTVVTTLALYDLISGVTASAPNIKWPNDLLVDDKKVCGILIENQLQGHSISTSVIGIGLNVNQLVFDFPTATSLAHVGRKEFELEPLLHQLFSLLEARYLQLRHGMHAALMDDYLLRLYRFQQPALYEANNETFEGTILGVDDWGKLKMETPTGLKFFDLKEIQYR
jgi:BirA family transcriptional regulator, biotin operon repressor / biotin---[acetyl-CoA-carboxylase] ligase